MELPKNIQDLAHQAFKKYDKDNSGFIEFKELKQLMNDVSKEIKIPIPSDEELNGVLNDTDLNKDKKLQASEFLELFKIIYIMKHPDK